jgi:hypothetical protein
MLNPNYVWVSGCVMGFVVVVIVFVVVFVVGVSSILFVD